MDFSQILTNYIRKKLSNINNFNLPFHSINNFIILSRYYR